MRVNKRTYIDNETTKKMIEYFNQESIKKKEERQVIYTYHTEADFRLIRTLNYVKLDLKENANDGENRVYINKLYESDMINILKQIGMYVAVKRYRIRHMYQYNNFYITIDENMKYGNVLRIGFESRNEDKSLNEINKIYEMFNIHTSSMETFQELYSKYRVSWADLTKDIDEEKFLKGN